MSRRFTTRLEDARFMASRLRDAIRPWKSGDRCLSYDGRAVTSVRLVEAEIATLANGDTCHVSKIRSVPRDHDTTPNPGQQEDR